MKVVSSEAAFGTVCEYNKRIYIFFKINSDFYDNSISRIVHDMCIGTMNILNEDTFHDFILTLRFSVCSPSSDFLNQVLYHCCNIIVNAIILYHAPHATASSII